MRFVYRLWPNWIRSITTRVPDSRIKAKSIFTLEQVLFSGVMMFILRFRSLRSFSLENKNNPNSLINFQRWISINDIPSDDQLRYCLQTVSTKSLNNILKDFHQQLERKKTLYNQKFFSYELLSLDGTGHICSAKIHCEKCLIKKLKTGQTVYYHGQLLGSLTNSKATYSLPIQFEPIERSDVETEYSKNDCELNAGKRFLINLKTQFPKRSFCFLADNLFAVDPFINMLKDRSWHFIITAKPERNKELFFMFNYVSEKKKNLETTDVKGILRRYQWSNQLPLKQYTKNEKEILVNLVVFQEINSDGEILYESTWMTDLEVNKDTVKKIAQAGRARFVIENRNFNEQKNLGFSTEHNFGHFGNLPNVFFGLAQIAQLMTELFRFWKCGKEEIKKVGSKRRYFERLAVMLSSFIFPEEGSVFAIFNLKFEFNST
jgi:hypothetical protein